MTTLLPGALGAEGQASPTPIRIVIADDHQWVREGFRGMLHCPPAMTVVGLASNTDELAQAVRDTTPDIAVIDHALGGEDGLEAAAMISRWCPAHVSVTATPSDAIRARLIK